MKKTYSSPRLTEYGPVNSLTNLHGNPTASDLSLANNGDPIVGDTSLGSSDGTPAP